MDSTGALELPDIPKSLLVVGGGYIGLELGSVYAALGTKVTVVEMTGGLLPGADRDLVNILAKRIEKMCEAVLLNTKVVAMKEAKDGHRGHLRRRRARAIGPKEQTFDRVLVSIGRRPNGAVPGLDKTGVKVNQRGFIEVNEQLQTAEPSIYAIGDVVGEPMLAHKASHEGRVAVEAIAGEKVAFEPLAIPAVVFTDPELAWCGLTESDAQKQGRKVTVARFPWAASGRALTLDRPDGMTKLIVDPDTRAHPRRRHRRPRRRRADRRRRAGGRDGRERDRPQDVDPSAPDAVGNADGIGRSVLRPRHARLPAEARLTASRTTSPIGWRAAPRRRTREPASPASACACWCSGGSGGRTR